MAKKGNQSPTQSLILSTRNSLYKEAVFLYEKTERKAQKWQINLLKPILAHNRKGLWIHTKFGYSLPRRNGKNEIVAIREMLALEKGEQVLHTAHAGARPDHAIWQGKVCHVGGAKDGYEGFEETTGYGTVTGLCGANCRHSFFPFFPGISSRAYTEGELEKIDPEPFEYEGKKYSYYGAAQKQRYHERQIRKAKREVLAAKSLGTKDELLAESIKLRRYTNKYKDFSRKAGLRVRTTRTQEINFGRQASGTVVSMTEKHHRVWLKSIGAENSKLNTVEKYYKGMYNDSKEYHRLTNRNKEFKLLFKNNNFTDEQLNKCRKLYNEAEKRNFIASSHFMERFIKREFNKHGIRNYNIDSIVALLNNKPVLIDVATGRLVRRYDKVSILSEGNRLVTIVVSRINKKWKKI